jgi:hypothetical protein
MPDREHHRAFAVDGAKLVQRAVFRAGRVDAGEFVAAANVDQPRTGLGQTARFCCGERGKSHCPVSLQ